jgi:hypothetical protein
MNRRASLDGPATPTPTESDLERHFQRMLPRARMQSLDDLSGELSVGCVDGRRPSCVAAAPGGNAGLLALLLATWEREHGRHLPDAAIDHLFGRYLDHFGSFYMHTDRDALAGLATAVHHRAGPVDVLVRNPSPPLRPLLLDALMEPQHVGCGHLRLMLQEPGAYGTRGGLVRAILRSFFRRLWDGDTRLILDVLDGAHDECGVARIRARNPATSAADDDTTARGGPALVPACPRHEDLDLFVYHPDPVAWLQALHALFLVREGLVPPGAIPSCIAAQGALGDQQLEATLRRLAPDLPVFDILIEPETGANPARVAVRLVGSVMAVIH